MSSESNAANAPSVRAWRRDEARALSVAVHRRVSAPSAARLDPNRARPLAHGRALDRVVGHGGRAERGSAVVHRRPADGAASLSADAFLAVGGGGVRVVVDWRRSAIDVQVRRVIAGADHLVLEVGDLGVRHARRPHRLALAVREAEVRGVTHDALVDRRDLRNALGVGVLAEHDRAVCEISDAEMDCIAQSRALSATSASVSQSRLSVTYRARRKSMRRRRGPVRSAGVD